MSDSEYDSVFEAVYRTMAHWRPRPKAKPIDLSALLALPRGHQVMKLRSLRHLHTVEVARDLVQASDRHRFGDPSLALHLAQLAVYAAEAAVAVIGVAGGGLPGQESDARDQLAEALSTLGNAHRIVGDTKQAVRTLKEATLVARQGSGDPLVRAKIEWCSAVVMSDRGRLDQALFLYYGCLELYETLGEEQLAHWVQIYIGQTQLRAGRPHQALAIAYACLERYRGRDEARIGDEMWVARSVILLLAQAHLDLGDARRALREARMAQECCGEDSGQAILVRGEWIEARAQLALGDWQEGVAGLDAARQRLLDIGALADAALAHLELALAHADACHWDEATAIARQAFGTLATAGLTGQALLALQTVARAAEGQRLTGQVLREAIGSVSAGG